MIFGTLNQSWEMNCYRFVPSSVRWSHFTLGNPKKSVSAVLFIHNSDYLCYLRRKQTVIHLPITPENVTTLTCELQNFFIRLEVCCVLSNVRGSEESQLWVVVGGSEKNRLWCVATGMSGKQCRSKCSEWPPSALIVALCFLLCDKLVMVVCQNKQSTGRGEFFLSCGFGNSFQVEVPSFLRHPYVLSWMFRQL